MKKEMTCIVCPLGCLMTATIENGKVLSVEGNTCNRGKVYAEQELIAPKRVLTTTVRVENRELVSVKSSDAMPKDKLFESMEIINNLTVKPPIYIGDVIVKNIADTLVDIVATKKIV